MWKLNKCKNIRLIDKLFIISLILFFGFIALGSILFALADCYCNGCCDCNNPEYLTLWTEHLGLIWIFGIMPFTLITGIISVLVDVEKEG